MKKEYTFSYFNILKSISIFIMIILYAISYYKSDFTRSEMDIWMFIYAFDSTLLGLIICFLIRYLIYYLDDNSWRLKITIKNPLYKTPVEETEAWKEFLKWQEEYRKDNYL